MTHKIVKQDNGCFTIFDGMEQHCDEDGNPIRYNTYEEAKEDLDILKDTEESIWENKILEQLEQM